MNYLEIDVSVMTESEIHEYLAEELEFPEWYGHNLDALYDCLGDLSDRWIVEVIHSDELSEGMKMVLTDAAMENEKLTVLFN